MPLAASTWSGPGWDRTSGLLHEMDLDPIMFRLCCSEACGVAELDVLEHPGRPFGPILAHQLVMELESVGSPGPRLILTA
jgi:hypothetical protein